MYVPPPTRQRVVPRAMSMAASAAVPNAAAALAPFAKLLTRRLTGRKSGVRLTAPAPCTPPARISFKFFECRYPAWHSAPPVPAAQFEIVCKWRSKA
jgi:hypothetical protein